MAAPFSTAATTAAAAHNLNDNDYSTSTSAFSTTAAAAAARLLSSNNSNSSTPSQQQQHQRAFSATTTTAAAARLLSSSSSVAHLLHFVFCLHSPAVLAEDHGLGVVKSCETSLLHLVPHIAPVQLLPHYMCLLFQTRQTTCSHLMSTPRASKYQ
jgi:hypothetical protein